MIDDYTLYPIICQLWPGSFVWPYCFDLRPAIIFLQWIGPTNYKVLSLLAASYYWNGREIAWSTILLKDSHLFKIIELVINFYFKIFSNSTILNKRKFFSGMMDHHKYIIISPHTPTHLLLIFIFFRHIFIGHANECSKGTN